MPNVERAVSTFGVATLLAIAASACVGEGNKPGIGANGGSGGSGGTGATDGGCIAIDCGNGCHVCGSDNCAFFCGTSGFGGDGGGGFGGFGGVGGSDEDGGVITQPWTSPFSNNGEDGTWRSTSDTFCAGTSFFDSLSLWSDERGVYVLASGALDPTLLDANKQASRNRAPRAIDAGAPGAAPPPMDAGFGGEGGGAGFAGFGGSSGFGGFGGSGGTGEFCDPAFSLCASRAIYFNGGDGWRVEHVREGFFPGEVLSGLPAAALVVQRPENASGECALSMIDGDTERCEHTGNSVPAFFAVDAQLAFATVEDNLLVFDGAAWSVHPTTMPFAPTALWANATDVVIVGDLGRIARLRDGSWTSANHSIQRFTSVWGGEGDALWVGTDGGEVMRRDASGAWIDTLRLGGVTCARTDAIRGLWGADGVVYAYTLRAMARVDGNSTQYVGNWSCSSADQFGTGKEIRRVWGNAPDEVFIVLSDQARRLDFNEQCGDGFVLYYDGSQVHRL